jgi:hypothetical protein
MSCPVTATLDLLNQLHVRTRLAIVLRFGTKDGRLEAATISATIVASGDSVAHQQPQRDAQSVLNYSKLGVFTLNTASSRYQQGLHRRIS